MTRAQMLQRYYENVLALLFSDHRAISVRALQHDALPTPLQYTLVDSLRERTANSIATEIKHLPFLSFSSTKESKYLLPFVDEVLRAAEVNQDSAETWILPAIERAFRSAFSPRAFFDDELFMLLENEDSLPIGKVIDFMNAFGESNPTVDIFIKYCERKAITTISRSKFISVFRDIDRKLFSTYTVLEIEQFLKSSIHPFWIYEGSVPLWGLSAFFQEKELTALAQRCDEIKKTGESFFLLSAVHTLGVSTYFESISTQTQFPPTQAENPIEANVPLTTNPSEHPLISEEPNPADPYPSVSSQNDYYPTPITTLIPQENQDDPREADGINENVTPDPGNLTLIIQQLQAQLKDQAEPVSQESSPNPIAEETMGISEVSATVESASEDITPHETNQDAPDERSSPSLPLPPSERAQAISSLPESGAGGRSFEELVLRMKMKQQSEAAVPEKATSPSIPSPTPTELSSQSITQVAFPNPLDSIQAALDTAKKSASEVSPPHSTDRSGKESLTILDAGELVPLASSPSSVPSEIDWQGEVGATTQTQRESDEPRVNLNLEDQPHLPAQPPPASETVMPMYEFVPVAAPFPEQQKDKRDILRRFEEAFQRDVIKRLFKGKQEAFEEAVRVLNQCRNWREASVYIDQDIFQRYKVDEYCEEAITFTDLVFEEFYEKS